MSYVAPAGTPVALADILHGLVGGGARAALPDTLRRVSGLAHAWPMSSGRAAMVTILEAMRTQSTRDEVVVPAYTCYSVPAAIERAGLKVRLCDVDPDTLGLDTGALARHDFSRTLAVISANLYGLPNDLGAIERLCRERGAFLLDDAAQALGARLDGRAVGSFGDAGLYSFDKGKIISTMQGGAIVSREGPLAAALAARVATLPASPPVEAVGNMVKLFVYSVFLRPRLYALVRAMPGTGLGQTPYEMDYPITQLTRFQTNVAARLAGRLDQLNGSRRRIAGELTQHLRGLPGIVLPTVMPRAEPVYARFPVRVRDAARRSKAIAALDAAGIGATASYPLALCDVPEVRARLPATDHDCPGARTIATTLITLPTHAYCPADMAARVHGILRDT